MYTWIILQGIVPNLHSKCPSQVAEKHERLCKTSPVKSKAAITTIKEKHTVNLRSYLQVSKTYEPCDLKLQKRSIITNSTASFYEVKQVQLPRHGGHISIVSQG